MGKCPDFDPVEELLAGRHFEADIVVLFVRWYLSFKLSYRGLAGRWGKRHELIKGDDDANSVEPAFKDIWRLLVPDSSVCAFPHTTCEQPQRCQTDLRPFETEPHNREHFNGGEK